MRRIIILLALALFSFSLVKSERILETVLDRVGTPVRSTKFGGKVLISAEYSRSLLVYSDYDMQRFIFPLVDGHQMYLDYNNTDLVNFEGEVFFALYRFPSTDESGLRFLFKFNGERFTRILLPGNMVSNCIVYGSYLYFLCDIAGTITLVRYSHGAMTAASGSSIPRSNNYELFVSGTNMYITGFAWSPTLVNCVQRYNGTSFFALPWPPERGASFRKVDEIPGTTRAYFSTHNRIYYYSGGIAIRQVFDNIGGVIYSKLWRNDLYVTTQLDPGEPAPRTNHLYRISGPALTEVPLPRNYAVAYGHWTNPEVYNGSLYIGGNFSDGSTRLLRYDGSSFHDMFTIPTAFVRFSYGVRLHLRETNLIVQPHYSQGNHAFEYDGTALEEIIAPEGRQSSAVISTALTAIIYGLIGMWTQPAIQLLTTAPPMPKKAGAAHLHHPHPHHLHRLHRLHFQSQ